MTLTQQQEFDALVEHAKLAGQARDWQGARQAWVKALELLPPDSEEYRLTKTRIENIDLQLSDKSVWKKRFAKLGPIGTFLLVALSKGKLLLLGLTKLSTFASMLAFFAVYWSLFGWKFALGFVLSIYIHEMGHVMALRKYNIAASAPMFIPFVGAHCANEAVSRTTWAKTRAWDWRVPSGDLVRRLRHGSRPSLLAFRSGTRSRTPRRG